MSEQKIDPRIKADQFQLIAAKELIQAFLYAIDVQPEKRAINFAVLLRASALLRGAVPTAAIRDDQLIEALDAAELLEGKQ